MMENLSLGLSTALIGMIVVFAGLVILILCIVLLNRVSGLLGKKKKHDQAPRSAERPGAPAPESKPQAPAFDGIDPGVIALYDEVEKQYRYSMSYYEDETNYSYLRDGMILRFARLGYSEEYVCDMLVKYLFQEHQSTRKAVFWMCFGEIVLRNLQRNLPPGSIQCRKCGERFKPSAPNQKLCDECAHYQPVGRKTLVCCDCGRRFEVAGIVKNKKRCDECQRAHIRAYEREKKRRQRAAAACAPVSV